MIDDDEPVLEQPDNTINAKAVSSAARMTREWFLDSRILDIGNLHILVGAPKLILLSEFIRRDPVRIRTLIHDGGFLYKGIPRNYGCAP